VLEQVRITHANAHIVLLLVQGAIDMLLEDPTNTAARKKCALSALHALMTGVFKVG
jgi:hypothetical protein